MYAAIHKTGLPDVDNPMTTDIAMTVLTQYHVSKALKIYETKGKNAVLTELKQLHNRMVMDPLDANKLTNEEKNNALQYLMFFKEEKRQKD